MVHGRNAWGKFEIKWPIRKRHQLSWELAFVNEKRIPLKHCKIKKATWIGSSGALKWSLRRDWCSWNFRERSLDVSIKDGTGRNELFAWEIRIWNSDFKSSRGKLKTVGYANQAYERQSRQCIGNDSWNIANQTIFYTIILAKKLKNSKICLPYKLNGSACSLFKSV